MLIIEIQPLENGAHRNQRTNGVITPPEGWAVVPDTIEIPDTFPFVDITINGQTVTSMTSGVVPEPEPQPDPKPTTDELLDIILGVSR